MTKSFFGETGPTATPPVTASIPVQPADVRSDDTRSDDAPSGTAGGPHDRAEQEEPGDHPPRSAAPLGVHAARAESGEHRSPPVRQGGPQGPVAADSSPVRFDDASVRRVFFRGTRASA